MTTIEERYGCDKCHLASCEGCDSFLLVKGATEQQKIDATQFSLAFCDAMCGAEKRGICDMRRVTCAKLAKFLNDGMKEE